MSEVLRALPGSQGRAGLYQRLSPPAHRCRRHRLHYPTRDEIAATLHEAGVIPMFIPEELPATASGDMPASEPAAGSDDTENRRINIGMLGVFAGYTHALPRPLIEQAISQRLPRFARQNMRTFLTGWQYGELLLKNA